MVFCEGTDLLDKYLGKCTIGEIYPNDLGFRNIADGLTDVIAKLPL